MFLIFLCLYVSFDSPHRLGGRAMARPYRDATNLFELFGGLADGHVEAAVSISELYAATCHHTGGSVEELCHRHIGISRRRAFAERGHEIAREARAVDIDTHAEDGGRVEHRIDAGLGVVAHD